MRELKFRVWNNNTNKYEYTESDYYFVIDQRVKAYDYEQYTGLKDKNGKEIYEGDIIQEELGFDDDSIDGSFKYKVFWSEETLCWSLDPVGNESIHDDLWECNSSVVVIGNIHENPGLLKDE